MLPNLGGPADFLLHNSQSTKDVGQISADHLIHIFLVVHRIFHIPVSYISPHVSLSNAMHPDLAYFIRTSSLVKKSKFSLGGLQIAGVVLTLRRIPGLSCRDLLAGLSVLQHFPPFEHSETTQGQSGLRIYDQHCPCAR